MKIFTSLFYLHCMIVFLFSICPRARSQFFPYAFCPNTTIYNPNVNSIYKTNLNSLLSSLSNASRANNFYTSATGRLYTSDEAAYGLFMCRGDVTGDACVSCVQTSTDEILSRCSDRKTATIWDDNCMLRYSNQSIFSLLDRNGTYILTNVLNVSTTDLPRFTEVLANMLSEIATKAANDPSEKKFAVQEGQYSSSGGRLYILAQCTPDLSITNCYTCLKDAISHLASCCGRNPGARVLFSSCNVRYETYKFYSVDAPPSPPPPPKNDVTPPSPATTPTPASGKG